MSTLRSLYTHVQFTLQLTTQCTCTCTRERRALSLHKFTMFVPLPFPPSRALFEYNAGKDDDRPAQGLSFSHGDILHILNIGDDEWWQAALVGNHAEDGPQGLIPSKNRYMYNCSLLYTVPVHVHAHLYTFKAFIMYVHVVISKNRCIQLHV